VDVGNHELTLGGGCSWKRKQWNGEEGDERERESECRKVGRASETLQKCSW